MVIMRTFKPFRYISVSLISASLLLLTLACGGDDDDGGGDEAGGTKTATGGSGGTSDTGSGGTTATESGGTNGGGIDAGPIDGGQPLPENVAEGGECTHDLGLFKATGTCSSSADCPGGLPTQFDLSGISEVVNTLLTIPPNDQINCASGLTCCINTNQCQAVSESLAGNDILQEMLSGVPGKLSIECVASGSCTAASSDNDFGELTTGCEEGQSCCVNIPIFTSAEGGIVPTDASAGAEDSGNQNMDAGP